MASLVHIDLTDRNVQRISPCFFLISLLSATPLYLGVHYENTYNTYISIPRPRVGEIGGAICAFKYGPMSQLYHYCAICIRVISLCYNDTVLYRNSGSVSVG